MYYSNWDLDLTKARQQFQLMLQMMTGGLSPTQRFFAIFGGFSGRVHGPHRQRVVSSRMNIWTKLQSGSTLSTPVISTSHPSLASQKEGESHVEVQQQVNSSVEWRREANSVCRSHLNFVAHCLTPLAKMLIEIERQTD